MGKEVVIHTQNGIILKSENAKGILLKSYKKRNTLRKISFNEADESRDY